MAEAGQQGGQQERSGFPRLTGSFPRAIYAGG
jgi:hypothetical protein